MFTGFNLCISDSFLDEKYYEEGIKIYENYKRW